MRILGVLMILVGIAAALYVGIWVMAVGGIIQFIEGVKMTPVNSEMVAWGIVKVILASVVSTICFWTGIFLGSIFISIGNDKSPRKIW